MNSTVENRNQIISQLIEFYRIQPGVDCDQLEKIEEYFVLMDSFYRTAIYDFEDIEEEGNLLEIIDVLNSYINSVSEETEKIFPDENNQFHPISFNGPNSLNELQVVELMHQFNGGEQDKLGMIDDISRLEEIIYEEDFSNEFLLFVQKLIDKIHARIIVKVDDLI